MSTRLRVRHGVEFHPLFGYRAVREWNGERSYIGPWTTEAQAQKNADEATRITHEVIDSVVATGDAITLTGDTPLGVWTPRDAS